MALSKAFYLALLLVFDTFVVQVRSAAEDDWTYSAQDKWPVLCLTGRRQSPMPINTYESFYDQSLTAFRFLNFNFNVNGTLTNTGARGIRWVVDLPDEDPKLPKITGGGLSGDYFIRYLDFRWAGNECEGSDHYVDFKPSPLEIQLVAYRSSKANSDSDLTTDTIAIFSYLFEYGDSNTAFTPIFTAVERVRQAGAITNLNLTLSTTLPSAQSATQYYRYNGSLATPPCAETAVWTLFATKLQISKPQMQIFRNVQALGGGPVPTAFRQLQQPNGRRVITNVRSQQGNVVAAAGQQGKGGSENAAAKLLQLDAVVGAVALFVATLFAC